jgi:galactokinase
MSKGNARHLLAKFNDRFGSPSTIYRAPGRVNLIGEHTDYNDGFVLPAALGFSCWVAAAPRHDRKLVLYSENFDQVITADLDCISSPLQLQRTGKWSDYPLGVAWALEKAGYRLQGANLYIVGEVPLGAGLSSSAAVEVSTAYALIDVAGKTFEATKVALLCQQAENEFVGMRCGIMDQFISCYGSPGGALLLDCRSLKSRFVSVPSDLQIVVCNTMVRHSLSAGEYNARRLDCESGVRLLSNRIPRVRALRDVTMDDLESNRDLLSETFYRRCRHVISENLRTEKAVVALESGNHEEITRLMQASHHSLREDFEVSCRELDVMVAIAMRQRRVVGARMTGGGFGGCTVNLVDAAHAEEFRKKVATEYEVATGLRPDIYVCETAAGAEKVGLAELEF